MLYVLVNGVFAISLYFGLIENVEGALNIAVAFSWIAVVCTPILFIESSTEIMAKRSYFKQYLDLLFDICVSLVLIWFDYTVLGSLYLIHAMVIMSLTQSAKRGVMK